MKDIRQEIQQVARRDFSSVLSSINRKQNTVTASMSKVRYFSDTEGKVTASCDYNCGDCIVEASIDYSYDAENIYADSKVSEVANAVLGAMNVPILAADGDEDQPNDAFDFDVFDEDDELLDPSEDNLTEDEETDLAEEVEIEDPEGSVNIETDNNIDNHYIVECDRCHGVFISALVESDEVVEHITGICPLCEKESDQFVKWVVKPVEFN